MPYHDPFEDALAALRASQLPVDPFEDALSAVRRRARPQAEPARAEAFAPPVSPLAEFGAGVGEALRGFGRGAKAGLAGLAELPIAAFRLVRSPEARRAAAESAAHVAAWRPPGLGELGEAARQVVRGVRAAGGPLEAAALLAPSPEQAGEAAVGLALAVGPGAAIRLVRPAAGARGVLGLPGAAVGRLRQAVTATRPGPVLTPASRLAEQAQALAKDVRATLDLPTDLAPRLRMPEAPVERLALELRRSLAEPGPTTPRLVRTRILSERPPAAAPAAPSATAVGPEFVPVGGEAAYNAARAADEAARLREVRLAAGLPAEPEPPAALPTVRAVAEFRRAREAARASAPLAEAAEAVPEAAPAPQLPATPGPGRRALPYLEPELSAKGVEVRQRLAASHPEVAELSERLHARYLEAKGLYEGARRAAPMAEDTAQLGRLARHFGKQISELDQFLRGRGPYRAARELTQRGEISLGLLAPLATGAVGAATGAGLGDDMEERAAYGLLLGLAGASLPAAAMAFSAVRPAARIAALRQTLSQPVIPQIAAKLGRLAETANELDLANLLSRPRTIMNATLGSAGAVMMGAATRLAEGNLPAAGRIVRTALQEAVRYPEYLVNPPAPLVSKFAGGPPRTKVLELVLRPFQAADAVASRALAAGGYSADEAQRLLLTGTPTSRGGQDWLRFAGGSRTRQFLFRFPRVAVQYVERGAEFSPLGFVGQPTRTARSVAPLSRSEQWARAAVGSLAAAAAEELARERPLTLTQRLMLSAITGGAALPVAVALQVGTARRRRRSTVGAVTEELAYAAPGLREASVRRILTGERFVPLSWLRRRRERPE